MEKNICATLYKLNLNKFSYNHPYHKFDSVIQKSRKQLKQKTKKPHSFAFENLPKHSLDLKFRIKSPTYSPAQNRAKYSDSTTSRFIKQKRKNSHNLLNSSIQLESKFFSFIAVRGFSANILRRKKIVPFELSEANKASNDAVVKKVIKVKIKQIKFL
jgi:hypothetical protein